MIPGYAERLYDSGHKGTALFAGQAQYAVILHNSERQSCNRGVASVDPDTMEIREYSLPEGARPRRIAITGDDTVYYTDYARGRIGRLDPKSGKVDDLPSPGGSESGPYGMAATPDGIVWYSESGVKPNTIVSFDPKTKTFSSRPIPSGGGVVRHMVSTPPGDLYIACSGENKVGIVKVKR